MPGLGGERRGSSMGKSKKNMSLCFCSFKMVCFERETMGGKTISEVQMGNLTRRERLNG